MQATDALLLGLGWLYVALRAMHAYIHTGDALRQLDCRVRRFP